MYSVGNTTYGLCFFEHEELISYCEFDSVRNAKDIARKNNLEYLIFGCKEVGQTKKLVWMVYNGLSGNDEDSDLLFRIYTELFSFDDSWKNQNV